MGLSALSAMRCATLQYPLASIRLRLVAPAGARPQVKETMAKFEEKLWGIIRNFIELGRSNPSLLVSAVRVVELQEYVDKQTADPTKSELNGRPGRGVHGRLTDRLEMQEHAGKRTAGRMELQAPKALGASVHGCIVLRGEPGTNGGILRKLYRKRCEEIISMAVQDAFAPLLQSCARLSAQGENTDKATDEILAQVAVLEGLAVDPVAPSALPPR
jgi:Exocyst complex component Sec6